VQTAHHNIMNINPKFQIPISNKIPNSKSQSGGGFTLIELLVVIAIIGILSTLLLANFNAARERARDAQRKNDIGQIRRAMELYKNDQTSPSYPAVLPACNDPLSSGTQIYMQKVPCDPLDTTTKYTYTLGTDNISYTIVACLENIGDASKDTTNTCTAPRVSYTRTEP